MTSTSTSSSPNTVCGALTRSGTACQNTLVTGCGRCPVHAAHLRAAHNGFKQRFKNRRKKSFSQSTYSTTSLSLDHFMFSNSTNNRMYNQSHQSLESLPLVYQHVDQTQNLSTMISPQQQTFPTCSTYTNVFKDDDISIGTPVTPNAEIDDDVHHLYCDNLQTDADPEPSHLQSPHRLSFSGEFSTMLSPKYVIPFEQNLD